MPPALRRRLEQVAAVHRQRRADRSQRDLAIFTDDELTDLSLLARKAEDAKHRGQAVAWTAVERMILERLEAKRTLSRGW